MKRKFLNILTLSAVLTTIGLLVDGDVKEPSMLMRFVEFFGMIGIIFLVTSTVYFTFSLMLKQFISLKE